MYLTTVDEVQDIVNFNNHVIASLPKEYRQSIYNDYHNIVSFFESLVIKGVETGEFTVNKANIVAQDIVLIIQAWAHRRWILRKLYSFKEYSELQAELILNLVSSKKPQ